MRAFYKQHSATRAIFPYLIHSYEILKPFWIFLSQFLLQSMESTKFNSFLSIHGFTQCALPPSSIVISPNIIICCSIISIHAGMTTLSSSMFNYVNKGKIQRQLCQTYRVYARMSNMSFGLL